MKQNSTNECSCDPRLRIHCAHFAGRVVYMGHKRLLNEPVAGYVVSGGHDAEWVEPDWSFECANEATALAMYEERAEGLRTIFDDYKGMGVII